MPNPSHRMSLREANRNALDFPNVRAFLRAIRLGEGTLDRLGYRRIVGGGEFDSYAEHPRPKVYLPILRGQYSSASGAYQIIAPTWDGLMRQYGFADFSPTAQDEAAVALIREKHALELVRVGRVATAIDRLGDVWASLPSSRAGQRRETVESVLAVYCNAGGTVVTA